MRSAISAIAESHNCVNRLLQNGTLLAGAMVRLQKINLAADPNAVSPLPQLSAGQKNPSSGFCNQRDRVTEGDFAHDAFRR
jgi:hypothetical protein